MSGPTGERGSMRLRQLHLQQLRRILHKDSVLGSLFLASRAHPPPSRSSIGAEPDGKMS